MARPLTVHPARRAMLRVRSRIDTLGRAWRARTAGRVVTLDSVQRRLELFLAALHGRTIPIEAVDSAPMAGFLRRHVLRLADRIEASDAMPATDGERILLPHALGGAHGIEAIAWYRLLALLQAERVVRGTVGFFPVAASGLVGDLYLIREAAAADASVSRIRGMRLAIDVARSTALASRPAPFLLSRQAREVEALVRRSLGGGSTEEAERLAITTPNDSLAWAHTMASRIGDSRRVVTRPVHHWGSALVSTGNERPMSNNALEWLRGPSIRIPIPGLRSYSDRESGTDAPRALTTGRGAPSSDVIDHQRAPTTWVVDPEGAGTERAASGASSPASSAAHERTSPPPREIDELESIAQRANHDSDRESSGTRGAAGIGAQYPEWDHVTGRYRDRAVTVQAVDVQPGDPAWANRVSHEHAVLIRQVRHRFEGLRASRLRSGQQLDGEELDIPACVRAAVDRHMGQAPDDRLYMTTRTARHPLAIVLLGDVSGSTRAIVAEPVRMIDIEKVALLIASEALASMGDRYALLAFAGRGPHGVRVSTIKDFNERAGDVVRLRIAGLEPGGFTRLGAAIRHATAALENESARHRLLIILSDGRPNDIGEYISDYGVEDSRQAVSEARARGVYPFCLNVDDEGSEYLARIFGAAGYTSLRHPDQLPIALLRAVHTLIRS